MYLKPSLTQVHNVVATNGTIVYNNICKKRNSVI